VREKEGILIAEKKNKLHRKFRTSGARWKKMPTRKLRRDNKSKGKSCSSRYTREGPRVGERSISIEVDLRKRDQTLLPVPIAALSRSHAQPPMRTCQNSRTDQPQPILKARKKRREGEGGLARK
jgi:hypothetical protein